MKKQILQKKTQSSYNHIIDYNNLRTQNIILYIIYNNNKGYNKIIIPDQGFNKKSSNH
jgi:hypothetical protein